MYEKIEEARKLVENGLPNNGTVEESAALAYLAELARDGAYFRRQRYRSTPEHHDESWWTLFGTLKEKVAVMEGADDGLNDSHSYEELVAAVQELKEALDPSFVTPAGVRGLWIDCPLCGTAHFDTTFGANSEVCDKCKPLSHDYSIQYEQWTAAIEAHPGAFTIRVRSSDLLTVAQQFETVAGWMKEHARQDA